MSHVRIVSQHTKEKAAQAALTKVSGGYIIHEVETSRTNERWLVAVDVISLGIKGHIP
jgi:hypothetical protein